MAEYRHSAHAIVRSEVPHDLDHEVSVQDTAGARRRACARSDPADLPGAGSNDHSRGGVAGPHPHAGVGAAAAGAVQSWCNTSRGGRRGGCRRNSPELRKRYWGQHLWARGYFCATVGAVDEKTIKAYIENQKWDEDEQGFKITAPTEP